METSTAENVEVVEQELEATPDSSATSLVEVKQDGAADIFWLAENIDKLVEAQKKIFMGILKCTMPGDFVAFGKGEKEKVELIGAACERIAFNVGISFLNWTGKREDITDEKGSYYRYTYEADAVFRSRIVRVMSVVSSRSKFFGKVDGVLKETWEVNRDDVQKSARRGVFKEGVKSMIGLRHLNRAELEKYGVKVLHTSGYDFKSKEENVQGTQAVTALVEDAKLDKQGTTKAGKPWALYKITLAEGDVYATFSSTDYHTALRAKTDGKPVMISYEKDDRGGNKITAISIAEAAPAGK